MLNENYINYKIKSAQLVESLKSQVEIFGDSPTVEFAICYILLVNPLLLNPQKSEKDPPSKMKKQWLVSWEKLIN